MTVRLKICARCFTSAKIYTLLLMRPASATTLEPFSSWLAHILRAVRAPAGRPFDTNRCVAGLGNSPKNTDANPVWPARNFMKGSVMLNELQDDDWPFAFQCAGEIGGEECPQCNSPDVRESKPGSGVILTPFGREDVAELYGISEGVNDGSDWICCGKLTDGRFFFLSAGCDYTGWDCQSGGYAAIAKTKDDLFGFGISPEEKGRMGIFSTDFKIPEEDMPEGSTYYDPGPNPRPCGPGRIG